MKKFLSLILTLVMVISCAAMIFADDAAVTTTAATDDETASAYYDAVKLLVSYNIMHGKCDGKLGVYDNIKRYEMALFIGRVLTGWVEDTAWEGGTQNSSEFNDLAGTAAKAYYGVKANNSQSYYYTMIYHENSTNTGKSANDRSYAVIYVYDFEDDARLTSDDFDPSAQPNCFGMEYNGANLNDVWAALN